MADLTKSLGWIGVGRMGSVLVERLLRAGCDVSVYNRTRSKAEPLADLGARLVDEPVDLADRDLVMATIGSTEDLEAVCSGPSGLLTAKDGGPSTLVDCSTISVAGSRRVRDRAAQAGTSMLAAPVSGNPKVARSGRLSIVVSGPGDAYSDAVPYLSLLGRSVTYVGDGEAARLVKIAHNLLLGVVTQSLAEIVALAERGGVQRADVLAFINDSVMGSMFTRYKSPAFVNLNFHPTFTSVLLRKDFEVGLEASEELDVPMPLATAVHGLLDSLVEAGHGEDDFATLLLQEAAAAGMTLISEDAEVDDGLHPVDPIAKAMAEGV